MKYRNALLKYNLQYFAANDNGNAGQDGADNSGNDGDDDQDEGQDDSQGEGQQKSKKSEKKYLTQEDVDRIVEERLKRERKKFQKQQTKDDNKSSDDTPGDDNAKKLSELEMKVLCYDHDIAKEYVREAIALAKAYMTEDEDIETMDEALEKVVEKFPQFVKGYKADKDYDEDDKKDDDKQKGSWGSRQGKEPKKPKTLEDEIREKLFG